MHVQRPPILYEPILTATEIEIFGENIHLFVSLEDIDDDDSERDNHNVSAAAGAAKWVGMASGCLDSAAAWEVQL